MAEQEQIKISHPDVENYGYVLEESLEVWLDLGWSVVSEDGDDEATEEAQAFTTHVGEDGEETMVEVEAEPVEEVEPHPSEEDEPAATEETPLPDEKESEQDDTADPKE